MLADYGENNSKTEKLTDWHYHNVFGFPLQDNDDPIQLSKDLFHNKIISQRLYQF